jgi:adenosine deaminase
MKVSEITAIPKVLLHDHVDGGLRAQTIIELAREINFDLPSYEAHQLQALIYESCNEGSLEKYLKNFDYTIAVMQSHDNLVRVARECVEDLARDGIVYAEVRGAPELFTQGGLSIEQVIEATLIGLEEGMENVARNGGKITVRFITCAMRHTNLSLDVARATLKYRNHGVVGFDIAGPEAGYPAKNHKAAFDLLYEEGFPFTIHAGEADSVDSMIDAIHYCRAKRIGHGVRIMDAIDLSGDSPRLNDFAQYVLDQQIHLEMAPTSNLQTGAALSYEKHPAGLLHSLGFNLALNTDNRLMSNTTLSREYELMSAAHGWSNTVIAEMNTRALSAVFDKGYALKP